MLLFWCVVINVIQFCSLSFLVQLLQKFASSLKIPFLETSAKNADNVEKSFLTMASEIQKRVGSDGVQSEAAKVGNKINSAPLWPGGKDEAATEEGNSCC